MTRGTRTSTAATTPASEPQTCVPPGPSPAGVDGEPRERLTGLVRRCRYEVLPLAGIDEQVEQHLPPTSPVTVTASPRHGLEPTLEVTEALARRGFSAVPHLAARLVHDAAHLAEILQRLDEAGVSDVFVVAGDGRAPVGDFADSVQLLAAMSRLRRTDPPAEPTRIGVAGYPEGHPLISDDDLSQALLAKQALSTYVVTQMCFEPAVVGRWVDRARRLGLRLPVYAGVPGPVERLRLLRVAGRIGVGGSLRVLRKQRGGATLVRTGSYRPDRLLEDLAALGPPTHLSGLHVYTLGDVAGTARWRRELLDRLTAGGASGG